MLVDAPVRREYELPVAEEEGGACSTPLLILSALPFRRRAT